MNMEKNTTSCCFQQNTGSNKTVEEIRLGIMEDAYTTHLQNLIAYRFKKESDLFAKTSNWILQLHEDMLDDIQQRMFEDFPEVSELSYHIKRRSMRRSSSSSRRSCLFQRSSSGRFFSVQAAPGEPKAW